MRLAFAFIMLLFLVGCSKCQTGTQTGILAFKAATPTVTKTYTQIGTLVLDNFDSTALSPNWSAPTGVTYSVSGGYLHVQRSGASTTVTDAGAIFQYKAPSTLRNYTEVMEFILDTVGASTFGPEILVNSLRNPGQNMTSGGVYNLTTSANSFYQYIQIFGSDSTGKINVAENASRQTIVPVAGHRYKYTFGVNEGIATFTVNDMTAATSASVTYSYDYANYTTNHVVPNLVQYALGITGNCRFDVDYFKVTTTESYSPDYVFIGDSFTDGLYGGAPGNAWFKQLATHTTGLCQEMAGGWDRSSDVLLNMPEILKVNGKTAFVMIGINDLGNSVPLATLEANFTSIASQLTNAGTTVIPLMTKTGGDPTTAGTYNKWLKDTYPNTLDTYTGLYGSGYIDGSGHPNSAGETQIADRIRSLRPDLFPN